jgi:hypothetical protein
LNAIWSLGARNPAVDRLREADPEAQACRDQAEDITRKHRPEAGMTQLETQAQRTNQQEQKPRKLSRRAHGDTLSIDSSDSRSLLISPGRLRSIPIRLAALVIDHPASVQAHDHARCWRSWSKPTSSRAGACSLRMALLSTTGLAPA